MGIRGVVVGLASAAVMSGAFADVASGSTGFVPAPCPKKPFAAASLQRTRCGFLDVPENRNKATSRDIRLLVAIVPAKSRTPAPDPTVYLAGGPGSAAIQVAPLLVDTGFNRDRDLIILEQRGTLGSEPALTCPGVDRFNARAVGLVHDAPSTERRHVAATRACRKRLLAKGADLAGYNTTQNAADIADLRKALGIAQWDVFGVSYGTDLALSYMRDYPQGIRSVTLASVDPPSVATLGFAWTSAGEGFRNVFRACRAQPRCNRRYPRLERTFDGLVRRLASHPLITSAPPARNKRPVKVVLDGAALVTWMVDAVDHDAREIPSAIDALRRGQPGKIAAAIAPGAIPEVGVQSYGLSYGAACSEDAAYERPSDILRLGRLAFPTFPTSVLRQAPQFPFWTQDCRVWNVPKAPASQRALTRSSIPTLILSGTFDAKTGARWGRYVARALPNATVVRLPGIGHAVLSTSSCARRVFASFLLTPTAPDVSCVRRLKPRPFAIH
jgi:pimeloyl-ACP methyl ester carboxylesterase